MEIKEFVEASMLGDGCLRKPSKSKQAFYRFTQIAEHKDYIDRVYDITSKFIHTRSTYYETRADKHNAKPWYILETRTHPLFTEMHARWYCSGVKRVPEDIKLDLDTLAIWIMDDGTYHKNRHEVKLCTNAFSFKCAEILKYAMYRDLNLKVSIRSDSCKKHPVKFPMLFILPKEMITLESLLGDRVTESFKYKIINRKCKK